MGVNDSVQQWEDKENHSWLDDQNGRSKIAMLALILVSVLGGCRGTPTQKIGGRPLPFAIFVQEDHVYVAHHAYNDDRTQAAVYVNRGAPTTLSTTSQRRNHMRTAKNSDTAVNGCGVRAETISTIFLSYTYGVSPLTR